jgi:hypothetical protein
VREFKSQVGFLTIAQNNGSTDYLELAYRQAVNIKQTQTPNQYAVIVDAATAELITDQHRKVFDHIIVLPQDHAAADEWKLANEWQVFNLTPFKETIKLESDLLFTRDISHWLTALRLRDVCFSLHCKDYQGNVKTKTDYRKLFEVNNLPDIYSGMYYFRYTQTATEFFKLAKQLYLNWSSVAAELIQCEPTPTTDVVFALAAKIIGCELCTVPSIDFFNFAHMKSSIQGWSDRQPWTDYVNIEFDGNMLRINNLNQYHPVHYYQKDFYDIR